MWPFFVSCSGPVRFPGSFPVSVFLASPSALAPHTRCEPALPLPCWLEVGPACTVADLKDKLLSEAFAHATALLHQDHHHHTQHHHHLLPVNSSSSEPTPPSSPTSSSRSRRPSHHHPDGMEEEAAWSLLSSAPPLAVHCLPRLQPSDLQLYSLAGSALPDAFPLTDLLLRPNSSGGWGGAGASVLLDVVCPESFEVVVLDQANREAAVTAYEHMTLGGRERGRSGSWPVARGSPETRTDVALKRDCHSLPAVWRLSGVWDYFGWACMSECGRRAVSAAAAGPRPGRHHLPPQGEQARGQ